MHGTSRLIVNMTISSFVLSAIYTVVFSSVNGFLVSRSYISDPGWFPVFIYFFLVLLIFHALLSILGYAAQQWGKPGSKLWLFIGAGILLNVGVCLTWNEWRLLVLLVSLFIFALRFHLIQSESDAQS